MDLLHYVRTSKHVHVGNKKILTFQLAAQDCLAIFLGDHPHVAARTSGLQSFANCVTWKPWSWPVASERWKTDENWWFLGNHGWKIPGQWRCFMIFMGKSSLNRGFSVGNSMKWWVWWDLLSGNWDVVHVPLKKLSIAVQSIAILSSNMFVHRWNHNRSWYGFVARFLTPQCWGTPLTTESLFQMSFKVAKPRD